MVSNQRKKNSYVNGNLDCCWLSSVSCFHFFHHAPMTVYGLLCSRSTEVSHSSSGGLVRKNSFLSWQCCSRELRSGKARAWEYFHGHSVKHGVSFLFILKAMSEKIFWHFFFQRSFWKVSTQFSNAECGMNVLENNETNKGKWSTRIHCKVIEGWSSGAYVRSWTLMQIMNLRKEKNKRNSQWRNTFSELQNIKVSNDETLNHMPLKQTCYQPSVLPVLLALWSEIGRDQHMPSLHLSPQTTGFCAK